jgi:NADH dehydrogenase FAD-containing subunit
MWQSLQISSENVPNFRNIFAIGDIAALPGIKRAGTAMLMGSVAAHNIFSAISQQETCTTPRASSEDATTPTPELQEFIPENDQKMSISIGNQLVSYDSTGTHSGEEHKKNLYGDDMGLGRKLEKLIISKETNDGNRYFRMVRTKATRNLGR